jgi:hypothetical protein
MSTTARRFWVVTLMSLVATLGLITNAAFAQSKAKPQNPQDLTAAVADLEARVAKLEGNISAGDLVGTYRLRRIQMEFSGGPGASVSSYVATGTAELAADGTFTLTSPPEDGNTLRLLTNPPSVVDFVGAGGGTFTGTWSYANGVVMINGAVGIDVAAAGKILVFTTFNHDDGTNVLLVLSRL